VSVAAEKARDEEERNCCGGGGGRRVDAAFVESVMETAIDKECSAMGAMFQQIITDMKAGAPMWEDFLSKAAKLHTALKSTLSVIAAYLDAFQKIADAATNAKGATRDIGTVLTRICLRHRAVEARLKTFSSALIECLVLPLQDKLEEWKKFTVNLDKEHSKGKNKPMETFS